MQSDHSDQIMVAVLDDMVKQSLPRMLAIRHKLEQGDVLIGSELDFFIDIHHKLSRCNRVYEHDRQCMTIFACLGHLLFNIINLALENEQSQVRAA